MREAIAELVHSHWLTLERPPASIVHNLVCARVDALRAAGEIKVETPYPSRMAVYRYINANIGEYDRVAGREGLKAAQAKVAATHVGPNVHIPLRVVEFDHTRLDIMLVDGVRRERAGKRKKGEAFSRPWLTVAIDVATRMIVGFHIDFRAPSWISVMRTLRMGMLKKDLSRANVLTDWPVFGVPEIVKLDNGPEFHSNSIKAAAAQLGVELRYCRRGRPHLKGRVERFFGEVARDYCAHFPGRTFPNVVVKADYKPEEHACLTLAETIELFTIWVVDIYHNKPHTGLMGKTPLERWQELSGFEVRLPPKVEDLVAMLGQSVNATIGRSGIRDGELNVRGRLKWADGLAGVVLGIDDVRSCLELPQPAIDRKYPGYEAAARRLECDQSALQILVSEGIVQPEQWLSRYVPLFDEAQIQEILEGFISIRELDRRLPDPRPAIIERARFDCVIESRGDKQVVKKPTLFLRHFIHKTFGLGSPDPQFIEAESIQDAAPAPRPDEPHAPPAVQGDLPLM